MIYFDNAATTFPKPPAVTEEMVRCMREYGGNAGRSGHVLAVRAAEAIYDCRAELAAFFGITKPENVVFTANTTGALNLVIGGLARYGDHFLISDMEHNSVARPMAALREKGVITVGTFHAMAPEQEILRGIEKQITPYTKAVVAIHASNVCPAVLPIREIGALCRKHGILYVVDAAQSAGIYDIDVTRDHISALCVPGHKGLYGPQGSGAVIFADDFPFSMLAPTVFGGNGVRSEESDMGREPPESYEAGTLATPGIAGLCRGVRFLSSLGTEAVRQKERELYRHVREELCNMPDVRVFMPWAEEGSLILFTGKEKSGSAIAASLADRGICTRAGLHCAPSAHRVLGTGGDAVRVSFSVFNTLAETDRFLSALRAVLKE
ncbi:MAG: aminotransferase class V-fold PLP-dependent enzyme [Ruminococcus sp.]|nr:aminotransferase class V-fold PLP-dependent enzyme [Candidatus Apopatosoma intestinale]